jgi:hypothetical protein
MKCLSTVKMLVLVGMLLGRSFGQDVARVKIAQGEYVVSTDEDLGIGPVDTEGISLSRVLGPLAFRGWKLRS